MTLRIEEIWAFVALDPEDQTEGIISVDTPLGHMPLVGADLARVQSLRPYAHAVSEAMGVQVKLLRFTTRTELPA